MYVCETVYFFFVGFQVLLGAAISIDFEEFAFLPGISQPWTSSYCVLISTAFFSLDVFITSAIK